MSGGREGGRWRLSGIPFKVLLFDELVGVLTSGHVTKMVTLFDLPWLKPLLYANFTALSSVGLELSLTDDLHCGDGGNLHFFVKHIG